MSHTAQSSRLQRGTRPSSSLFSGAISEFLHPPRTQNSFLDGLRTIAILLVINGHVGADFATIHGDNFYSSLSFVSNGWIGVDLFFVLSGFFIGGQLWKELQKTNTISVRRFVLRRGLRIWPLYFFTYFCVLFLSWHGAAAKGYGWADLCFLVNYFNHGIVLGGWTLSTEEQFYIVTPLLLYLFARNRAPERIRIWLWAALISIPLMRIAIWVHHTGGFFQHDPDLFGKLYYEFHTHCDGLIMGLILSSLWLSRRAKTATNIWPSALLVLAAFVSLVFFRWLQHELLVFTGLALFFGSVVWFGLTTGVRWFDSRLFYWISRLSFGMYLNHAYLLSPMLTKVMPHIRIFGAASVPSELLATLLVTLISAAIAFITFCLIEHPFLNLRARKLGSHPVATA